jgi:hypothetical protein
VFSHGSGWIQPGRPNSNWYNPKTGESLRWDQNHPKGFPPYSDYVDLMGNHFRCFEDGTMTPKGIGGTTLYDALYMMHFVHNGFGK